MKQNNISYHTQPLASFFVSCLVLIATPVFAANVKVTPLGSHDGEF